MCNAEPETDWNDLLPADPGAERHCHCGEGNCGRCSSWRRSCYCKVGEVVKVSLQTKDPAVAKQRFTQALASVDAHWEALKHGPSKLTHKQFTALAGEVRSAWVKILDDDPGDPAMWQRVQTLDATVKRYHSDNHDQLRCHLSDVLAAYSCARRLQTLSGLTSHEYICEIRTSEPDRFIHNPNHQIPELNIWKGKFPIEFFAFVLSGQKSNMFSLL